MTIQERVVEAYERTGGNIRQVARELGRAPATIRYHVRRLGLKRMADGRVGVPAAKRKSLPKKGQVKRYILTSAQNNTHVHPEVWASLTALAEHYEAEILVGTFTYNQNHYGELSVKRGKAKKPEDHLWYDELVVPHIVDEAVELAPGLEWRGEMNILPTAVDPLNGFETYTHRKSGIFPQAKFAMRSVPSGKHEATKFNYTTGTCTQRNYVQKRAGLRAEHHHGYGGLVVEVDSEGRWFVRQLHADEDGTMYDLDLAVESGEVYENDLGVEAITWGDIHHLHLDPVVEELAWGEGGMLDTLSPRIQVFHDLLSGAVTNHHESRNPHERFRRHTLGGGWTSLADELRLTAEFLRGAKRDWCESVVADSNHDRAWIERWLRETDYRNDPENAILFLKLQLAVYEAIDEDPESRDFHILEHAMEEFFDVTEVRFLREDESYIVADGKIECGSHGHLGPNGRRGNPQQLAKVGRRANTAHTHTAGIYDGLYVAGASCRLDMGYNNGPSSWSQSHIVTYPNGKRTIVTVWDGRWRA